MSELGHDDRLLPEDLPRWEQLKNAFDGLLECMKRRPDGPLDQDTDFHRDLADALKPVGDALEQAGLSERSTGGWSVVDDWGARPGAGSYARQLLQFSWQPTPKLVGGLLARNAKEPSFLDDMRRRIAQYAQALLEATRPASAQPNGAPQSERMVAPDGFDT